MERKTGLHRHLLRGLVPVSIILCLAQSVHSAKTPCALGQWVGVENPGDFTSNTDTGTGNAYLLSAANLHIPCCGLIDKYRFYSVGDGELKAHVWRNEAGSSFKLIDETVIPDLDISPNQYIIAPNTDSATIDDGDLIGWFSLLPIIPYSDVTSTATADGVQKQATTPVINGLTTWVGPADITRRFAFGAWTKPSDPPYFTNIPNPAVIDVPISTNVGDNVFTLEADDKNRDDKGLGLNIEIDGSSTYFEVDNSTGAITVKTALAVGTEDVNFIVTDFCGMPSPPVTITFNIIDDRPNITSLPIASYELKEDAKGRIVLHTLKFTDDGPLADVNCDYIIDEPGPFLFERSAEDYEVIFQQSDASPLDADKHNLYTFWFVCNDGTSNSTARKFEVSIIKNESPDLLLPTEITHSTKDLTNGSLVHDLSPYATDPENDELEWSMECLTPTPVCPFRIDPVSAKLFATEDLRTHKVSPYAIAVTVSDQWGNKTDTTSVVLTDLNTVPVLDNPKGADPIETQSVTIDENTDANLGTRFDVYTVKATDPDLGEEVDFLFNWEDAKMADYFDITVDKLAKTAEIKTKVDIDYEKIAKKFTLPFNVDITAVDSRGEISQTGRLEINIKDINEPPKFKEKNYKLDANEDSADTELACALFNVEDKDFNDYHKFYLDCGNGIYHIDPSYSGSCLALIKMTAEHQLDPPNGPNKAFETSQCTVTVEDQEGLTDTAEVEIVAKEIDDNPPELAQTQYIFYATNETRPNTLIGNLGITTDLDVQQQHKEFTYTLNTNDFIVDKDGQIRNVIDLYGVALPKTYTFYATVKDNAQHSDTARVDVIVNPVYPTTTSATTTTQFPQIYDAISDFFGDIGNLIWMIAACLLGALFLGLLAYTCARCLSSPGACAAFRGGNCFGRGGSRRTRPSGPSRTQKNPPRGAKQPPKEQPAKRRRLFDCFDRKDKGDHGNPGARDPAKPDEGRMWEAWRDDFNTRNWVG